MLETLLTLAAATILGAPPLAGQPGVDFDRDIRPILSDACYKCHGPDAGDRKAGLRLDLREGLFGATRGEAGEMAAVVVPGSPQESELARRVGSDDPDERMPPPEAARQLTEVEVSLLGRWIAEGGTWSGHWAFEPVGPIEAPGVSDAGWCRNEIDRFVLAVLEHEGLRPAAEADRRTFLRRVSLDLTGLAPSGEELAAFLADDGAGAYERAVDRLLASSRFGEHFAAGWLDAARYADSNGFQLDPDRTAWPWRDWVIRAFNENMPYDEFAREQIAGDLLPGAGESQILATMFNRNHPINGEGGRDVEESRNDYVNDRVDTTSTVWLGLTMACAQCHDHKYDPVSQKDYYRFAAYFNSIDEDGSGDQGDEPPLLEMKGPDGGELHVMVMRERTEPRQTHVLVRGAWDAPGEAVGPGTPERLWSLPGAPANRLGLAEWVADPANPLTARVEVNRLWQAEFGAGLVRTPGNFGIQGERPTHPELLDWLAGEFMRRGWDVKAMLRLMVTSATYRQSSACGAALFDRDPENRLLARASRFRLASGVLRDQALGASGLLVERVGGPPVKPYHPAGVWEDVSFGRLSYAQGTGDELYRRSLYTFWRRTAAPANMFDTSMRQKCSVRVIRTNTPLQALILMNDETYAEAAAALAERTLYGSVSSPGASDRESIARVFEAVLGRPARAAELAVLTRRLVELRAYYADHADEASAAACVGERPDPREDRRTEIAALAGVCSVVFNLDEALSRE
ncbi:MAG: PSD1 domain-containing protein [Phycisphaerales bacterium]|nr:PSD1 domain-containing protein [Phycisphaerales bacterium]